MYILNILKVLNVNAGDLGPELPGLSLRLNPKSFMWLKIKFPV